MTTPYIGQVLLGLIAASVLIAVYRLGQFVEQKKQEYKAAEAARLKATATLAPPPSRPAWISKLAPSEGSAGFTIAAALSGVGCLGRSRSDEPVFVLCARDKAASKAVRCWADEAEKLGANARKTSDARALADRMEVWREAHGGGKVPD